MPTPAKTVVLLFRTDAPHHDGDLYNVFSLSVGDLDHPDAPADEHLKTFVEIVIAESKKMGGKDYSPVTDAKLDGCPARTFT